MLNKEYEQAYISTFVKLFTILKNDYEVYVTVSPKENYEIKIISANNVKINDYLSICFQKQNGSFVIVAKDTIDKKVIDKLLKDISITLNDDIYATYNFKDYNNYDIYHFVYVIKDPIISNEKILKDLYDKNEINNLIFEN